VLSAADSAVPVIPVTPPIHPTRTLRLPRPLQLWHLTSLDAPTVASVWTWFVARAFHARILPSELAAMFLAVWMIYAIDRLLDASAAPQSSSASYTRLQPRHLFHLRHRRRLLAFFALASIALGLLLTRFPGSELVLDLALLAVLAGWFALVHRIARRFPLPKELAVGVFFPAAVFLPVFFHRPDLRTHLILPAVLFGLLCAVNALFIHRWEALPKEPPSTIRPEDALTQLLLHLHPLTALFCLGTAAAGLLIHEPASRVDLASGLSTAGLLILDRARLRFEPTDLRALADLVLLSPLLLTVWLR